MPAFTASPIQQTMFSKNQRHRL